MKCRFKECIPLSKQVKNLKRELVALREKEQSRAPPRALPPRRALESQLMEDEAKLEKLKREENYVECAVVKRRVEQARQVLELIPEERTRISVGRELQKAERVLEAKKKAGEWSVCVKCSNVVEMLKQELAGIPEERTRVVVEREMAATRVQLDEAKNAHEYGGLF
jgi:hypothetical protein